MHEHKVKTAPKHIHNKQHREPQQNNHLGMVSYKESRLHYLIMVPVLKPLHTIPLGSHYSKTNLDACQLCLHRIVGYDDNGAVYVR